MRTVPPFVRIGSWASSRWLKLVGTGPAPATRSAASGPGTFDWKMKSSFVGDVGEGALGHAEVLGQDLFRSVGEPVGERERVIFAEVAVVEDEQELAAVALKSLDRVRDAGREVPQVPFADIVLEGAAFLVDGGDPRPALEHEGPLGRLVPVQLADPAGLEPHVDQGKGLRRAARGSSSAATSRLPSS